MRQHHPRHLLHVIGQNVIAAANRRQRAGRAQQRQRSARRGAQLERLLLPRRLDDRDDVAAHRLADPHLLDRAHHQPQPLRLDHRLQLLQRLGALEAQQNRVFLIGVRITHAQTQQEAVQLRFGQRECAFKLDRILRRDHQEGARQRHRLALDRQLAFLHRLQQSGLRARRGAVDLVGEHQLRQQRPGPKLEIARFLVVDVDPGHIRGQQIGGELDAAKRAADRAGERFRQHRFAQPGHIVQQDVPLGEDRGQCVVEHLLAPDDHAPHVLTNPRSRLRHVSKRRRTGSRHFGRLPAAPAAPLRDGAKAIWRYQDDR